MAPITTTTPMAAELRKLRSLLPEEEAEPRKQEMPLRVLCRVRGQSDSERQRGGLPAWDIDGKTLSASEAAGRVAGHLPEFRFDGIYGPSAQQEELYGAVEPVVQGALNGMNGCVLCYGQTSAGKTFTMEGGKDELRGLIPRALETVFAAQTAVRDAGGHLCIRISMMEIYMERVRDLLGPESGELTITEDSRGGITVRGLLEVPVTACQHALDLFCVGQQHRAVAATGMNDKSSRSHSVFLVKLDRGGRGTKLCLVDLAGSECRKKALEGTSAEVFEQSKAINQSLTTLGLVVSRLAQRCRRGGSEVHIPYRSSKLTRILQDSLGGNSHTALVVNASISSLQVPETISTLRFGVRARSCVNVVSGGSAGEQPALLRALRAARQEIQRLRSQLSPAGRPLALGKENTNLSNISDFSPFSACEQSFCSVDFSPAAMATPRGSCSRRNSLGTPCRLDLSQVLESQCESSDEGPRPIARSARRSGRPSMSGPGTQLSHRGPPSPFIATPRSEVARSGKVSRSGSRSLSASPSRLALTPRSLHGLPQTPVEFSPRRSRRQSRASRGALSPLDLSPGSRRASRRVSRRLCRLPDSDDDAHEDTAAVPETPDVWSWEYPLTREEMEARAVLLGERALEKAESEMLLSKRRARRLAEQCEALRAENEWLTVERAQQLEYAVSASLLREDGLRQQDEVAELTRLASGLYVGQLLTRVAARGLRLKESAEASAVQRQRLAEEAARERAAELARAEREAAAQRHARDQAELQALRRERDEALASIEAVRQQEAVRAAEIAALRRELDEALAGAAWSEGVNCEVDLKARKEHEAQSESPPDALAPRGWRMAPMMPRAMALPRVLRTLLAMVLPLSS